MGGHWIKIHVSTYQSEGEPDIVGCYMGFFFAFELKVGKNTLSEMQRYKLDSINKAGGHAHEIRSEEEAMEIINATVHRV